jgi:hypothetical protein
MAITLTDFGGFKMDSVQIITGCVIGLNKGGFWEIKMGEYTCVKTGRCKMEVYKGKKFFRYLTNAEEISAFIDEVNPAGFLFPKEMFR